MDAVIVRIQNIFLAISTKGKAEKCNKFRKRKKTEKLT